MAGNNGRYSRSQYGSQITSSGITFLFLERFRDSLAAGRKHPFLVMATEKGSLKFLFDKPYYLEPQKGGAKACARLRQVLHETGRVGIARLVLRSRQYLAAV